MPTSPRGTEAEPWVPTGERSAHAPGSPLHAASRRFLAACPRASSAAGRAREEGQQTLISHSPGVPSVSYFFFFFPPFPPPSSQKGWFSSESLKHICIPKTSLGINSSQCRGLFFFFSLPILLLFLPSPFLSKPEMNSARTLAIPAPSRCATRDYKGSKGFPFLPTHSVWCCCLVLLLTIRRDKALSPISHTNLLPTFFSSQPWLPETAPELHPPCREKAGEKRGTPPQKPTAKC